MAPAEIDIERIVSEVVRRLRAIDPAVTSGEPVPHIAPRRTSELQVNERLVTLDTLHNQLAGIETVVVSPRAIVTPAVVDDLKDRGVTLTRSGKNGSHRSVAAAKTRSREQSARARVFVTVDGVDVAALQRQCGVRALVAACQDQKLAQQRAFDVISQGQPVVLITESPSSAVVAANRNERIRAAVGFNFPAVRQAVDEANANLLAIDPRGKSTAQLFGLINEFLNRI